MIRDVYVYNKNLERIGVIDGFRSCIWDNQYSEIGECELYVAANEENLSMLVSGYYLARDEDSMVCIIRKIEIDTSAEEGNYLIVTGIDSKVHCDQRIIEGTEICKGRVENFLHELAYNNIFNPVNTARRMLKPNGLTLIGFDYSGLSDAIVQWSCVVSDDFQNGASGRGAGSFPDGYDRKGSIVRMCSDAAKGSCFKKYGQRRLIGES